MMINYQNLSDHVAGLIRKMIMDGSLKPGEKVNQVQLAEKLNISRGPIREALRMLQNEGIIKHETNRGTFVTTLSKQDAYEIYTLRALLEGEAAQLAIPNLQNRDFLRLEELCDELQAACDVQDLERQAKCDIAFHQTIVSASRHQRLIHTHQQLDTQVGAMYFTVASMVPERDEVVVDIHRYLIDVLKTKEKERVRKAFSDHYLLTLKDLKKKVDLFRKEDDNSQL